MGVVYADLNGLKVVNDNLGHEAGDRLLRDAASTLREVFSGCEIYRVGGDEFVVIVLGEEEDFLQRVAILNKMSKNEECVSFSIGYHWDAKGSNLENDIKTADEMMYADKEAYYKTVGKNRRRV